MSTKINLAEHYLTQYKQCKTAQEYLALCDKVVSETNLSHKAAHKLFTGNSHVVFRIIEGLRSM